MQNYISMIYYREELNKHSVFRAFVDLFIMYSYDCNIRSVEHGMDKKFN